MNIGDYVYWWTNDDNGKYILRQGKLISKDDNGASISRDDKLWGQSIYFSISVFESKLAAIRWLGCQDIRRNFHFEG